MRLPGRGAILRVVLPVLLLGGGVRGVQAQLRPLDPVEWSAFDAPRGLFTFGLGVYDGQRASLAGTEGRLTEIGTFRLAWRSGQVVVEASGTAVRRFRDERVFAEPAGGSRPPDGHPRLDTGAQQLSTVIRLTPVSFPFLAGLRFGVRLPTTNNVAGLDRDQTDFFATVGGRWLHGALTLSGEAGVGVNGTRDPRFEQVDPVLYAVGVRYRVGGLQLRGDFLGQHDTRRGPPKRGTEDLQELRLGLQTGGSRWLRVTLVRGFADVSPDVGLTFTAGLVY